MSSPADLHHSYSDEILGDPEVTANIYCKSRNVPIRIRKITVQICGSLLGHPVYSALVKSHYHPRCIDFPISRSGYLPWLVD